MVLLSTVTDCIEAVCEECKEKGIDLKRIKGTNMSSDALRVGHLIVNLKY